MSSAAVVAALAKLSDLADSLSGDDVAIRDKILHPCLLAMSKFTSDASVWAISSQCISKSVSSLGGGMSMATLQNILRTLVPVLMRESRVTAAANAASNAVSSDEQILMSALRCCSSSLVATLGDLEPLRIFRFPLADHDTPRSEHVSSLQDSFSSPPMKPVAGSENIVVAAHLIVPCLAIAENNFPPHLKEAALHCLAEVCMLCASTDAVAPGIMSCIARIIAQPRVISSALSACVVAGTCVLLRLSAALAPAQPLHLRFRNIISEGRGSRSSDDETLYRSVLVLSTLYKTACAHQHRKCRSTLLGCLSHMCRTSVAFASSELQSCVAECLCALLADDADDIQLESQSFINRCPHVIPQLLPHMHPLLVQQLQRLRRTIGTDLSDDSKRSALKILAGSFHLCDCVALRCMTSEVVQCLVLCFALETTVGAPLGRRPVLISPLISSDISAAADAGLFTGESGVLMWPQTTLRLSSSSQVLAALFLVVRAWVVVVGADFALSALSSFACENEASVAAAAMACACAVCDMFSIDVSATAANSFCDVCSDILVQCRSYRHNDTVLCVLLRCIGSLPSLTRCSSAIERRAHALSVLKHRKSLLSDVISSIALASDLSLLRSCIDTCLSAWGQALGWSDSVSCVLEHSDWILDCAVSELRRWSSDTLAVSCDASASRRSEHSAAGLRGGALLSFLAQAYCSNHASDVLIPLSLKLVVFEIVSIVEESLSVLSLSVSMVDLLPHTMIQARGTSSPAPTLSHTEMVCIALLRCLELTVACINQREPWPSSVSLSNTAVHPTQPQVTYSELLSILQPDQNCNTSPKEPSPQTAFKDILSQSQSEDAPITSEDDVSGSDPADAKDPALASWVSIVQRALAASSCLVTDSCPGVRNQAILTAVNSAALLFRIDAGMYHECFIFRFNLIDCNSHSEKGRPALVQLWSPLSHRLVDSDAFARASALAALKAASKVDPSFFSRKLMDHVWPLLNARAFGGDAGALLPAIRTHFVC